MTFNSNNGEYILPFAPKINNYEEIQQINFTNNKTFKILYINFRSLNEKTEELIYILNEFKNKNSTIDIIAITEHWMNDFRASKYTLNGYNTIFSCRPTKRGGGSAIFVKNNINYEGIKNYSDNENSITSVTLKNNEENINICCIYRTPNRNLDAVNFFITALDDHMQQLNHNKTYYIVGDFNFDLLIQ